MYMWRFRNALNNARRDNIRHVHACLNGAILLYSAFLSGLLRGSEESRGYAAGVVRKAHFGFISGGISELG